ESLQRKLLKIKTDAIFGCFYNASILNSALATSQPPDWRESQFVKATLEQTVMIKITRKQFYRASLITATLIL
ncbi:hypothetical protein, partial [Treponema sp. UBA785]|uniref:hypothetical protein n=1 Tax=Treponema sp. UBA785 TaxID=1947757 RepID=UPI0025FE18B0